MKTISMFSVLFLVFLLIPCVTMALNWQIETVDNSGNVAWDNSLCLDSGNYPHISYYDDANWNLQYAYYDGASWQIETVDTLGSARFSSLRLDSGGYPHISHTEGAFALVYAHYDGSSWQIEMADSTAADWYNSLCLDSNDYPHISYRDFGPFYGLNYAYYDGTSWQTESVDNDGVTGFDCSLCLDSSDYPHISYYQVSTGSLKYAYYDGTSWQIETVDSGDDLGACTSLCLDSGGYPHISYIDVTNADLKYARYDGSSWQIETVDNEASYLETTSLCLDSGNYPHISYFYDDAAGGYLKYAYYDGSSWQKEIVDSDNVGGYNGYNSSLCLDSGDYPHISYVANSDGSLKYAYAYPLPDMWTVEYRFGAPAPGYSFAGWPTFQSWLEVRIENTGDGDAFNVTASVSDVPANITIVDGDVTLGDIPAGGSAWSSDTFTLDLDMLNPQNPNEGFFWTIEYDDSAGNHHVVENVPEFPPAGAPPLDGYSRLWYPKEYHHPKVSKLLPNYPNPFNPETWIPFQLTDDTDVTITIFTETGKLVRTLSLGRKVAGLYTDKDRSAYWDGRNEAGEEVVSGIYYCRMQAGSFVATRKLAILR